MTTTPTANRFLDMNRYYGTGPDRSPAQARQHARASSLPAASRVLVVLIENGGIDLGLPDLVDRLIGEIPGASSVISRDLRASFVTSLRGWLNTVTDHLLESAELTLNRYTAAKPDNYNDVIVLRDSTATFGELKNALFAASRAGKIVDIVILTHGSRDFISADDGINGARIRSMATEFGRPLNVRSVYMMNCVGASLNQAWLDIGARASAGSHDNNYLPEPTTYFFFSAWKNGAPFEQAITGAYRRTIDALNSALRGIVIGLVPLAGTALAGTIDVSNLPFAVSSRPEVVGTGGISISSDALPPASIGASTGQSLVTTVLPAGRALGRAMSADRTVSANGRSFINRFEAPGPALDQRIRAVERFLSERIARPLTQPQIDALASFGLGIGSQALEHSTLLRMLDEGDFASVPSEIRKWTRIRDNGQIIVSEALLERRRAEAELFGNSATQNRAVPGSPETKEYVYQQSPDSGVKPTLTLGQKVPDKNEVDVVGAIAGKIIRGTPDFAALVENTNPDIAFKDEEGTGADRMMTAKLRDKLADLASLVKTEWPGNKLRVTEAWDESGEHSPSSSHYEGRAADLTVDDLDSGKLGRLGQLAVDAGFDWVFYENAAHVHVSVKK